MATEILYTLKIEGTQTELDRLAAINSNIKDLKKEINTLNETDQKAAEAKKLQLQNEQKAYRDLQSEVKQRTKAEQEGVKTLAKMRAELALLNKQIENTAVGSKAFTDLNKKALDLSNSIRNADQAGGKFNTNIGNYKNSIIDAFQLMGVNVRGLTQGIESATTAFSFTTKAVEGTSVAMKVLKVALISTGIGALVVALGTLIAYFTGTQAGADKLKKVMIPLGAIFREITEFAENFGEALVKMFTTDIFKGWADMKEAIGGVGEKMSQAVKDGERLIEIQYQQRDASIALLSQEANINKQMAERVRILDNENNSQAVRKKAAEEAVQWQEVLNKLKIDSAKLEKEKFELENKNDLDLQANKEEQIRLGNKIIETETEGLQATKKIRNQLYAIEKKESDAALEAEKKRRESLGYTIIEVKKLSKEIAKLAQNYVTDISKLPEVDKELYDNIILGVELAKEATNGIVSEYDKRKKALDVALEEEAISEEEHKKAMLKLNAEYSVDVANQTAAMFNALSEIAGKNSKAGKAFAAAATLIDTYRSSMLAYKAGLELGGPLGLPIAIAQAAIATAFGLAQVKKIYATKDPEKQKYARGGIIGGRPHSQGGTEFIGSDGSSFEAERGEYITVVNKQDAKRAALLDSINRVHGIPLNPSRRMAFGGNLIPNPNTSIITNTDQIIMRTIRAIGTIPVVVSETDITSTQARVRKIRVKSDL